MPTVWLLSYSVIPALYFCSINYISFKHFIRFIFRCQVIFFHPFGKNVAVKALFNVHVGVNKNMILLLLLHNVS